MATTSRGIQYPTATDEHPSAWWWQSFAATTNAAIVEAEENAIAAASFYRGAMAPGTDLNSVSETGWREVTTGGVATSLINAPVPPNGEPLRPGVFEHFETSNGVIIQRYTEHASGLRLWKRGTLSATTGSMGNWRAVAFLDEIVSGGGGSGGSSVPAASHVVRAQSARARRSGTIGTNGKPVVALRFDHGWSNFGTLILPKLRELGLPASICANSDNWARAENAGLLPADVNPWLLQDGIELWNHSADHADHLDEAGIFDSIVGGAERLKAQFPQVAIDGWMPHGSSPIDAVRGRYDGFFNSSEDAHFDSYAGQLVMAYHAMATGYRAGDVLPLDGTPVSGARHYTADNASLANVQSYVQQAIDYQGGAIVMVHPGLLNTGGITTATVHSMLEWIAAQRDAGAIEVLTVGGLMHADLRSDRRQSLIPAMLSPASLAAGATTSRSGDGDVIALQLGGVRRIEVDIDMSSAGTVTVVVEGCGSRTLSAPAGQSVIARHVTVPLDASRCWVSATPSVAATVHNISALPV